MQERSEGFPGKAIGIAAVMDMSSGYGGSEDDRGREHEIISVIGSPNGLESMTGSQSIAFFRLHGTELLIGFRLVCGLELAKRRL